MFTISPDEEVVRKSNIRGMDVLIVNLGDGGRGERFSYDEFVQGSR
jgi:hypothetical protein